MYFECCAGPQAAESTLKYIRQRPLSPGTGTTSGDTTRYSPAPPACGVSRTPGSGVHTAPSPDHALKIRVVD